LGVGCYKQAKRISRALREICSRQPRCWPLLAGPQQAPLLLRHTRRWRGRWRLLCLLSVVL
jgi:hypothetical protein